MGGGLVQLVANKTNETTYLIGNPEITFFKIVYRRHTNFAIESIEQKFVSDPAIGGQITAIISRDADLCGAMYLEVTLPHVLSSTSNTYIYGVGNALVKQASIDIGGTILDTHYSDWLNIWSELSVPKSKREGYDRLVGNNPTHGFATASDLTPGANSPFTNRLYIPLQFWFNRNPGLALPLLALQNSQVKLTIQLASYSDITDSGTITDPNNEFSCKLYIDYYYLDNDERRRFNQLTHEYLIEQVQYNNGVSITSADQNKNKNVEIQFDRPVKELIWVNCKSGNKTFDYSNSSAELTFTAKLFVNGQDRFMERHENYFRLVQNKNCHTNIPRTTVYWVSQNGVISSANGKSDNYNQFIYTYSFALFPENLQPSGHCNFSRIERSTLQINYDSVDTNYTLKIFAVNYNVLRIAGGTASLVY